jgi:2-oxoisovalerate dehydrogenase E1 component
MAVVEVIDLRTLSPVDWDTILTSVRKTSRVLVAYEDSLSWDMGETARIADEAFQRLDAPCGASRRPIRSWRTRPI